MNEEIDVDSIQSMPLHDLKLARELIEQNEDLLIKYPSLEDSLTLLNKVIMMESDD